MPVFLFFVLFIKNLQKYYRIWYNFCVSFYSFLWSEPRLTFSYSRRENGEKRY
ncbi:hypothetical protein HMPREF3191_00811 [Veillonellaceae bacterium DNF00626]|nr:hypothetical protein HMPREF3191_00811 [Veillonellaceae bacterium DNF00626]